MNITPGTYRHYKGDVMEVIGVAKHSETLEDLVIYRHPSNPLSELWARPLSMFTESVTIDGVEIPRFTRMEA